MSEDRESAIVDVLARDFIHYRSSFMSVTIIFDEYILFSIGNDYTILLHCGLDYNT